MIVRFCWGLGLFVFFRSSVFPLTFAGCFLVSSSGLGCSIFSTGGWIFNAFISHGPEGYFLRDNASKNGVFLIATPGRFLETSIANIVSVGRQYLVFDESNGTHEFIHYDQRGNELKHYNIPNKTILLGRDAPDIILDATDMTLSRRHFALCVKENKILIKDLKSANGTFIKKNTQ